MAASVYFDHNATTPVDPEVWEAMLPWCRDQFGNASSRHEYGRAARRAIDEAREQIAVAVGAHATEIVFTSGGSEANNLFLKGAAARLKAGLLAVSAVEHPCVMRPAEQLARQGWQLCRLPVDTAGRVDEVAFQQLSTQRPKLVSIMMANNETGVLQDIDALSTGLASTGAFFHTDAVQALGKIPVDFRGLNAHGVQALTVSAHKIGGPKGIGALVLDKRLEIEPLIAGGGHERGLRSGTENVAAIVGFGKACERLEQRPNGQTSRLVALQQQLENGLYALGATVFGAGAPRLPNTVCFAIDGFDGETLVAQLDRAGYAVASGAACSSANPEPSHVLRAMGVPDSLARAAVRASLGTENTAAQVDGFLDALRTTTQRLQQLTAVAV